MAKLVLDIDFGERGNSTDYVLEGWGEPEPGHTWTVGQQSRLRLPTTEPGAEHTLVIRAIPWVSPPTITHQTVMLGLNDRLLETAAIGKDATLAFDLPPAPMNIDSTYMLTIGHLDSERSVEIDAYRDGRSMGLMMRSVRLVSGPRRSTMSPSYLPPLPGAFRGRIGDHRS